MPKQQPQNADKDVVEAIVTVGDAEIPRIHALAKSLARKGFNVSNVLESSGLIAGSVHRHAFDSIRSIKGVDALEASGRVDIGPPNEEVQ